MFIPLKMVLIGIDPYPYVSLGDLWIMAMDRDYGSPVDPGYKCWGLVTRGRSKSFFLMGMLR